MSTVMVAEQPNQERRGWRRRPSYLLAVDGTPVASLPRIKEAETLIGRAAHVALLLSGDPFASAYHALIRWDEALQIHVISDCGSRNGTFVDDVRVSSPIRLVDGARIRIGVTELFYRTGS